MSTADINAINQSLANIQSSFNDITGNTLSNYNQLSRIVSQQGNIYNTIYFGLGNLSTGNLNFTGNLFQNGSPYIGSQWTTLNGNIYYSSGNVGIKKTTPNFELDVNGNINLSGNLFQNGSPYIASQWTTSGSNIYYNVANGNVGIGTTTPYYALDIGGSANISSNVYCMNMFIINDCLVQGGDFSIMNGNLTVYKQFNTFGESVLNGNLTVYNADFYNYGNSYIYNGLYLNKNGALYTNNDVAGQHAFYSFDTVNLMSTLYGGADDTNRVGYFQARGYGGGLPLLLNPNGGNVGVGTGNPNTTLDVNGSVSISGVCYSSGSGSTYLNGNQLNAEYNINATAELAINYSGYLGGTTQFRDTTFFNGKNTIIAKLVGSSGNLGLGTTSPTATLDVNGDANISGNIFCKNYLRVLNDDSSSNFFINTGYKGSTQTNGYVTYNIYSGTGTHYFWDTVETVGNVGIGKAPLTNQLDLSTDSARKLTTNTWLTGSDYRIKEDIVDANIDRCYDIISNIKLKHYKWIPEIAEKVEDKAMLGWIAQDVETYFPKAVSKINEYGYDDFRVLNADQMYKVMYGALQKVIIKCDLYENEIISLKEKIQLLEK